MCHSLLLHSLILRITSQIDLCSRHEALKLAESGAKDLRPGEIKKLVYIMLS